MYPLPLGGTEALSRRRENTRCTAKDQSGLAAKMTATNIAMAEKLFHR
jgi:hypothetical protein